MPSSLMRGAVVGAVAMAAAATPAQAATELLSSPAHFYDATSDGRYVIAGDSVLDRATGTQLPVGTGTPLALADRAPRVLVELEGGALVVRDLVAGTEQPASVDVGGDALKLALGGRAELIDNGQTVLFTPAGGEPRIVQRDLASGTSATRLPNAALLDASEDGDVITFSRTLDPATRPAGSAAPPDAQSVIAGYAVGYQLDGQLARLVERSTATETFIPFFDTGACSERRAEISATTRPYDLQISQNGSGQYALYLSRAVARGSEVFQGGHTVIDRVTSSGTTLLVDSGNPSVNDRLGVDPVSGAYTLIHTTHGSSPLWNTATLVAQDGTSRVLGVLPVEGPGGSSDTVGFTLTALPVNGGAGAVYQASPRTADQFRSRPGVYADTAAAPGPSAGTPWLTLPRSVDAVASGAEQPTVTWADCGPVVAPPTIADYAAATLKTTGNSAGSVAVTTAPSGKAKATSVTASITWLGFPVYTRRVTADTTVKLPAIPVGIGGFKLTLQAKLADGTTVRSTTALRRTR